MNRRTAPELEAVDEFAHSALRQVIVAIVCVKIAGLILVFDPHGFQSFDLPKSLYSRAFEWLLVGVIGAALIQYGPRIVPRTWMHLLPIAVVSATGLSAVFAQDQYVALFGDQRYLGLTAVVDFSVLYFAVALSFRERDWGLLTASIGLCAVFALAYALIQYLGLDPLEWSADPQRRPFSTFGNPNQFAHFLSVVVSAGLAMTMFSRSAGGRLVAAALAVAALIIGSLVATRGLLLALAAAGATLVILQVATASNRMRGFLAALMFAALLIAASVLILAETPLGSRADIDMSDSSVRERQVLMETGLRAFADHPIVGVGPDNLGVAFSRYREDGSALVLGIGARQDSAHNFVVQTAATTGLLGLIAQIAFVSGFFWAAVSITRTRAYNPIPQTILVSGVAYWAHGLVTVGSIAGDWIPWTGLGVLAALLGPPDSTTRTTSRVRPPVAVLMVLITILASLTGLQAFLANRNGYQSVTLASTADAAADSAGRAVEQDPGRAEYWSLLGIARENAKDWRAAEAAYETATLRAPYEWKYWSNLARARLRQVSPDNLEGAAAVAAMSAARRAVETDSREPLAQATLAETAIALGHNDLALDAAAKAVILFPRDRYDTLIISAARKAVNLSAARERLDAVLTVRQSATLFLALAEVALRQGDLETARQNAKRTLELSPQNADARRILAVTGP